MADARALALAALTAVESGRAARLDRTLALEDLDHRDRAFARELAQGTERQHLFLDFVLAQLVEKSLPKDPEVLSVLRLGAYQLLFMWRVQDHAAVHETVALVVHHKGFVNGVLRNLTRRIQTGGVDPGQEQSAIALPGAAGPRTLVFDQPVLPPRDTLEHLAVLHGLPPFLVARWVQTLGMDAARQACEAASATPVMTLTLTHRAGEVRRLVERLAAEGVSTRPLPKRELEMLVWEGGPSPLAGQAFADGWFLVQGPAAHAAAQAVAACPGETVLDLCAAPGTKTVLLAEAVGPEGRVLAFDVDPERRRKINQNCTRVGLANRVRVLEELEAVAADGGGLPHRVLVDAPCSNTGVMARRLEVRRWISTAVIRDLARVQVDLLHQALGYCRPGGRVVYSTCSLDPEENQEVVAAVLATVGPTGCRLVSEQLSLPAGHAWDGGYFAVLETML